MIKEMLKNHVDLQENLFIRGFLATTKKDIDLSDFPFYGNWNCVEIQNVNFLTHKLTGFAWYEKGNSVCFLFGHAYNPFTMEIDEKKILERLISHIGENDFYDYVDELTGVFVLGTMVDGKISFLVDPSGMQSACYCVNNDDFFISSHPQLISDICGFEMDEFAKELINYKWYPRVMGCYLPADMTSYSEVKRIVPNISYVYDTANHSVSHSRFYPLKELKECATEQEYNEVICAAADILKKNMELVLKKWDNSALSLTGGIDSNTAFAAANGNYDKLKTFSYFSAEKESIDCEAAKKISQHFGVDWKQFNIPSENADIERFEIKKAIIDHNNAYAANRKANEVRKRMYLQENSDVGVEIKNWTSETIRAYWYKHYNRKSMPKLSGKLFRNLYKIFIMNRSLAHKVDKLFDRYIKEFEYEKIPSQYPPADMHYNEVTWGSWGGMNISEMKYYSDITIIYNNRKFLDLLFRVPLEKRISDQHHLDMKKYLNKELYDMNIRVVNKEETRFRANALNVIFTINSFLPF
ncbi:MAG: hypothetical protein E7548_00045 [Ruminococcaceae bacterium]|nr:hypothetical protein [Oscillospiraceae bacterium]